MFCTQCYLCVSHRCCFTHQLGMSDLCQKGLVQFFLRLCPWVLKETSWTIVHPSQLDLAKASAVLLEVSLSCAFDRKPACHEDGGKPRPHKTPSSWSGMCTSTFEVWKWLLTDNKECKGFVSNVCRSMTLQTLLLSGHSLVICQVSASLNCRTGMSSQHAGKDHKRFQACQVSCSLLELCRRHVVMLQVKILQVA